MNMENQINNMSLKKTYESDIKVFVEEEKENLYKKILFIRFLLEVDRSVSKISNGGKEAYILYGICINI